MACRQQNVQEAAQNSPEDIKVRENAISRADTLKTVQYCTGKTKVAGTPETRYAVTLEPSLLLVSVTAKPYN
jgi:hypothetical protein